MTSGNWSNIGFTTLGIVGRSYPVEESRHAIDKVLETEGTKWFCGTGSGARLQEGKQLKLLCVRDPGTLSHGLQEEEDRTMQQVW